jgi:hypothetical protein
MPSAFDLEKLLRPDLPPPALPWSGFPQFNFVGGHNDADSMPVDDLIAAATSVYLWHAKRPIGLSTVARISCSQTRERCGH